MQEQFLNDTKKSSPFYSASVVSLISSIPIVIAITWQAVPLDLGL